MYRPVNQAGRLPPNVAMDGNYHLISRNAQLETELRLIKEQLAQANNANLYLLKQMRVETTSTTHTPTALENQLQKVQSDNLRLTKQLRATELTLSQTLSNPDTVAVWSRLFQKSLIGSTILDQGQEKGTPKRPLELVKFSEPTQVDLLSIDDEIASSRISPTKLIDTSSSAITTPATSSGSHITTASEHVQEGLVGLGISKDLPDDRHSRHPASTERSPANSTESTGFYITKRDGTKTWIQTALVNDPESTQEYRGRIQAVTRSLPFLDGEHNRLMGAACFIETMTNREQREHWIRYAIKNPRHNAREWQEYFENVVWPKYAQKSRYSPQSSGPVVRDVLPNETSHNQEAVTALESDGSDDLMHMELSEDTTPNDSHKLATPSTSRDDQTVTMGLASCSEVQASPVYQSQTTPDGLVHDGQLMHSLHRIPKVFPSPPLDSNDLFYAPSNPTDHHRSALVYNLEDHSELEKLLGRLEIHRRRLLTVKVLKTAKMKTLPLMEFNTAMFLFLDHQSAAAFVKDVNTYASDMHSCRDETKPRTIEGIVIKTPCRPFSGCLTFLLQRFDKQGPTVPSNILFVQGLDATIIKNRSPQDLVRDWMLGRVRITQLLSAHYEKDQTLVLEFKTMLDAIRSYEDIHRNPAQGNNLIVGFRTNLTDGENKDDSSFKAATPDEASEQATTDVNNDLQPLHAAPEDLSVEVLEQATQAALEMHTSTNPRLRQPTDTDLLQ